MRKLEYFKGVNFKIKRNLRIDQIFSVVHMKLPLRVSYDALRLFVMSVILSSYVS